MPSAPPTPVRRAERGAVSWVTLLLLLLVVVGGYLGWVWIPVYLVHYEAKQVVRNYMAQAIKDPNDASLVDNMTKKLAALDEAEALDENGEVAVAPAVVVAPADVTWERDAQGDPPMIHVAFSYRRSILLPVLNRWVEKDFYVDLTGDLTRPNWGPAR